MHKVLVANRGEIALRIFRTCRALNIGTVAVYSEADKTALHVEAADTAICIGPSLARDSYLKSEAILDAAAQAGADAIHPGYGFLAENADFARDVKAAGLTWIGPSPEVIELMGDKQRAREVARKAGVPVVPGSERFDPGTTAGVEEAAMAVGFPLLVKAVAGGGGIGMRRVDSLANLLETVEATQSMASRAFGDGSVFLERFVPRARHIELQIFGFGDGKAVHFYERDCSVQRRFQKVIEESPAPGLPVTVRNAMAEAAVKLAQAVSYGGAGTVEFIVDADSLEFFFLEMNTRIQVEHPVTEMVVGCDLVKMQIDLVRGKLQAVSQDEFQSRGHAIECRLYAENPAKRFMPSPGDLTVFNIPQDSEYIRIDSGYRAGDSVTPFYDPMLAKVIVWGATREEARHRAIGALSAIQVEGLKTNLQFLMACLANPAFADGDVHTGFIDKHHAELLSC
tara:strand:+ start:46204 stop:47565 length:1362 start_codon:yes stop_codon:yes gene_type:complete